MSATPTQSAHTALERLSRRKFDLVIQLDSPSLDRQHVSLLEDPDAEIPPFLMPEKFKTHPHLDPTASTGMSEPYATGAGGSNGSTSRTNTTSTIIVSSIVAGFILILGALFWAIRIWRLRRVTPEQDEERHGGQRRGDAAFQEKFKKGWKKAIRRRRDSTWFDCPAILDTSHSIGGESYSVMGSSSYANTKFLIHDPEKNTSSVAPTLYHGSPERRRPDSDLSSIPSFEKGSVPPLEVGSLHKPMIKRFPPRCASPTSMYSQPSLPAGLALPNTPRILGDPPRETLPTALPQAGLTITYRHQSRDLDLAKTPHAWPVTENVNDNSNDTHDSQECLITTTSHAKANPLSPNTSPFYSSTSVTETIIQDAIYHQSSPQRKPRTPPRSSRDGSQLSSCFEYDPKASTRTPRSGPRDESRLGTSTSARSLVSFAGPSSSERVLLPALQHVPLAQRANQTVTPPARKPVKSILKSDTRDRKYSRNSFVQSESNSHVGGWSHHSGSFTLQSTWSRSDLRVEPLDWQTRLNTTELGQTETTPKSFGHGVALPSEPLRVLHGEGSIEPRIKATRSSSVDVKHNDIGARKVSSRTPTKITQSSTLHLPISKMPSNAMNYLESEDLSSGSRERKDLTPLLTALGIDGHVAQS